MGSLDTIDRRSLTVDQLAQLEAYDARNKQIEQLGTIADELKQLETVVQDHKNLDALASQLSTIHESLQNLVAKEGPEPLDLSPVVDELKRLKIQPEFKPEFKPNIQVSTPEATVDLSALENLLKTELPSLLSQMVPPAPEVRVPDNSAQFDQIIKTLVEVRDRPIPIPTAPKNVGITANNGTVGVTNPLPVSGFIPGNYDYVAMTYPDAVTDVFTFKVGGSSGSTLCTVTIIYTDSTKATMASVART